MDVWVALVLDGITKQPQLGPEEIEVLVQDGVAVLTENKAQVIPGGLAVFCEEDSSSSH
jgi:hypothetical protein